MNQHRSMPHRKLFEQVHGAKESLGWVACTVDQLNHLNSLNIRRRCLPQHAAVQTKNGPNPTGPQTAGVRGIKVVPDPNGVGNFIHGRVLLNTERSDDRPATGNHTCKRYEAHSFVPSIGWGRHTAFNTTSGRIEVVDNAVNGLQAKDVVNVQQQGSLLVVRQVGVMKRLWTGKPKVVRMTRQTPLSRP